MPQNIFLGRTQEQEQFRSVLRSLQPTWIERNLPTFSKPFRRKVAPDRPLPFIFLFYGEGGMGKTTLMRRLQQIVETDQGLKGEFNLLFLDWEGQQKQSLELSVGHDHIKPETVLAVLHKALVDAGWGRYFEAYRKLVKDIQAIETKVEQKLRSQPNPELPKDLMGLGVQAIGWIVRRSPCGIAPIPKIARSPAGLCCLRRSLLS